jgi:hypothetical protein
MSRKPHTPDEKSRKQVEALAGFGIPQADIALLLGIDPKTLRKHYAGELATGSIKANTKVAESLYQKALGNGAGAVTAAIFWAKTRMGWKETFAHEHTGKDGRPIELEKTVIILPSNGRD